MSDVTIPKARVWPKPTEHFDLINGKARATPTMRAGGMTYCVILAPRCPPTAYISNEHYARWRLDRQDEWIECVCPCGKYHWMDRDKLIKEVGGNMNVAHLVREWMPLPGTEQDGQLLPGLMWSVSESSFPELQRQGFVPHNVPPS